MVEQASGGEGRGNPTVTEDNRKAVRRAMENIENNTPNLSPGKFGASKGLFIIGLPLS